jgi:transcriptional regulator with XRE-family HTH domain
MPTIQSSMTDTALLTEVGARVARHRLEANLTQSELAQRAGVGLRTLQRLESGEVAAQLSVFLRVCRALGLVERIDAFLPAAAPGPIEQLERQGAARQRASGRIADTQTAPWRWADDA